jgi:uncharacterized OB-fold protein
MSTDFPTVFAQPEPSIDDAEFWEACNERELVVQSCADCGEFRHPPKPVCPECQSFEVEWESLPGTGEVYTYTIAEHPVGPDHEEHVPYNISVVLLDGTDDVRFITQIVDVEPEAVEIGMSVEVVWEELGDEKTIPLFRPRN